MTISTLFIVVTGTPGVGKTRFARIFGAAADFPVVSIGQLALREGLLLHRDEKRKTMVADLKRLARRVRQMAKAYGSRRVILEGHYSHMVVGRKDVDMAFVLRCRPGVLRRRLQRRGWTREKIEENVEAELVGVCSAEAIQRFGTSKVVELKMSTLAVKQATRLARRVLSRNRGRHLPQVDWLG